MIAPPKTRFQEHKTSVTRHLDLTSSPGFIEAADFALLQMVHASPLPKDEHEAAMGYHRILGARDYMRILFNLADAPKEREKMPEDNLR